MGFYLAGGNSNTISGQLSFTAPVPANWSWVNQGDATLDTTNGNLVVVCPNVNAGGLNNQRMQAYTLPGGAYTAIFGTYNTFFVNVNGTAVSAIGVALYDSVGGGLVNYTNTNNGNNNEYSIDKYTNVTTYNSSYVNSQINNVYAGGPTWIKIQEDGTNRIYSVSRDGLHWVLIHSIGRTDFITPNKICIFANPLGSACAINLVSFTITQDSFKINATDSTTVTESVTV